MALRDVDVLRVLARLGIETRRQGRELWARCPFHEERTASWRIKDDPRSEHHAMWQCFGSCPEGRRSGSIVVLVKRLLDLESRDDAWRWIGSAELERPPERARGIEVVVAGPRASFVLPDGVVTKPVGEWLSVPRAYLLSRGPTAEQAARWGIGYAASGSLAGRIVIPVRDTTGRLLSYTARTYVGSERKFREPDKAGGADKGAVFGEQQWASAGRCRTRVVVGEAAFDLLAVERVASDWCSIGGVFGSELLPGHVARLGTFEEIVVASDPDPAGDKLAAQIRAQLGRWRRVRRALFPPGVDASELARPGDGLADREKVLRQILEQAA